MAAANDINLDLLIKMMGMTTADNDGQVLVAIRKANELLSKGNADWETLLRGKVKVIADPFAHAPIPKPAADATWRPPGMRQPTAPPTRPSPTYAPRSKPRPSCPGLAWVWLDWMNCWEKPPYPSDGRNYVWNDNSGWVFDPPKTKPAPMSTQPTQTAIVHYRSRNGQWVLGSNEALTPGWTVTVVRKDGQTKREVVGSFIDGPDGSGIRFYNTSKTTVAPASAQKKTLDDLANLF